MEKKLIWTVAAVVAIQAFGPIVWDILKRITDPQERVIREM